MFLATRPTKQAIDRFLIESASMPLSYDPIGIARGENDGFNVDELALVIGRGEDDFHRAKTALAAWKHFDLGWLIAIPSAISLAPGTVVAVVIRHFGFWSMNGCRVVYGLGERQSGARFGFAYGTLASHAEQGEELFEVCMEPNGHVVYRIRAASRPGSALSWLGYPLVRMLQERFRRDSADAMRRAIAKSR